MKGVCYCCKTALAAGPDGTLFAAWRHVYAGNIRDIAFTTSRDGGRTFAAPARVSEDRWQLDGCPEDGPAMTIDAGGTAHIVWPTVVTQPETHKALFYATTKDGTRFTARTRVSPTRRNIAHPQIALSPDGEVAVFWDEIVAGRRRVFLSRRDRNGGFGAAESLSDTISASYPVSVFTDAAFVVAWTEGSGDDSHIVVRSCPPGTGGRQPALAGGLVAAPDLLSAESYRPTRRSASTPAQVSFSLGLPRCCPLPAAWQPHAQHAEERQERAGVIDEDDVGAVGEGAEQRGAEAAGAERQPEEQARHHADAARHELLGVDHDGRERRCQNHADDDGEDACPEQVCVGQHQRERQHADD